MSSRQVMAVLSSQGRGDAGTLPSAVNEGTAVKRECKKQLKKDKKKHDIGRRT